MNGNFASRLDDLILDHPEIAVWVHGHMHNPSDYQVGDTRVLCNPRGYIGYESRANTFELLHFEV
jgi:predicted phosphodiesterase